MKNKMKNKMLNLIPELVFTLCTVCDAWIVGSSAERLAKGEEPTGDLDVLVPLDRWLDALRILHPETSGKQGRSPYVDLVPGYRFGGLKFQTGGVVVDVFPQHLETYLLFVPPAWECLAVHPRSGLVVRRQFE